MRIGGMIWDAINIYDDIAVEIYFQGCTLLCKSCHNPQFQPINEGKELSISDLIHLLINNKEWFEIISCLGGEPLLQIELEQFISQAKLFLPDKKLWLFTGKDYDEIEENFKWCFEIFDVIKTGRYMKNLEPGDKLSSWNQKLFYKGKDY